MTAPVQVSEASAAASSTTIGVAQGSNPTVGNTNVVWVRGPSGSTVSGVADTLGHSYTPRGNVTEAGTGQVLYQFTAPITTTGANTVTATYGASTTDRGIAVVEGRGTYDASNTGTDAGNNPTNSVSATNTAQPATVLMLGNDVQGGTPQTGSGYTSGGTGWATLGNFFRLQYKEVTSTGSQSGNFGNSSFDRVNSGMVILDDLPSGPTITAQPVEQAGASGGTATFSVSATASAGSNSYQWQKQAPGAGSWSNVGTNSSSYTTGTLGASDNLSRVRVVITDSNGSVTSAEVVLVVTGLGSSGRGQELNAWTVKVGLTARRAPHLLRQLTERVTRGGNASVAAYGNWWGLTAGGAGTIVAAGITSAQAIGQPTIAPQVAAAGVSTGEAIGSAAVAGQVSAVGIASAEAEGQPALSAGITSAGIASAEAIGQPTVGSAAATIDCSGAGIASAQAIGAPGVSATAAVNAIGSAETLGQAALATQVAGSGVSSAEAVGQPAVGPRIAAAGIGSAEAVGSAATLSVTIGAAGLASAEALGQPGVGAAAASIVAVGIASAEALGQPALATQVLGTAIASSEAVGTPATAVQVAAAGVVGTELTGQPAVSAQLVAAGIASGQAIGSAAVAGSVGATAISSAEAFGLPSLAGAPAQIDCAGIASSQALGVPVLGSGVATAGIGTAEVFGLPDVSPSAAAQIIVAGIASGLALGRPFVVPVGSLVNGKRRVQSDQPRAAIERAQPLFTAPVSPPRAAIERAQPLFTASVSPPRAACGVTGTEET